MAAASLAHRSCCCMRSELQSACRSRRHRCTAALPRAHLLEAELEQHLQQLPGLAAVLPGSQQAKQQILGIITQLEQTNPHPHPLVRPQTSSSAGHHALLQPVPELLGDWDLVFASNGTVVTRTRLAQLLVALAARVPGIGLDSIQQSLSIGPDTPAGCITSSNQAVFGLGPLGSWRVVIRGSWRPEGPDAAVVQFDELGLKLCGWLGVQLPEQLPEVRIRLPGTHGSSSSRGSQRQPSAAAAGTREGPGRLQPAAVWLTTFVDKTWRVGRGGSSGNIFLFRRRE